MQCAVNFPDGGSLQGFMPLSETKAESGKLLSPAMLDYLWQRKTAKACQKSTMRKQLEAIFPAGTNPLGPGIALPTDDQVAQAKKEYFTYHEEMSQQQGTYPLEAWLCSGSD